MFEKRQKRTIIVVKITAYGEIARTHNYYLTYTEWLNKQADFDLKGKNYTWVDRDTILFIKNELNKEKES